MEPPLSMYKPFVEFIRISHIYWYNYIVDAFIYFVNALFLSQFWFIMVIKRLKSHYSNGFDINCINEETDKIR